jgi:hypothetical protein
MKARLLVAFLCISTPLFSKDSEIVVKLPPQNTTYSVTLPSLNFDGVFTTSAKVGKYLITHCLMPGLGALIVLSAGGVALAYVSGNLIVLLMDHIYNIPAVGPIIYGGFWGTAWLAKEAITKG